jgi:hypothetical protein
MGRERSDVRDLCAHQVKSENREKLEAILTSREQRSVPGFVTSYVLTENEGDHGWLFAIFEDRTAYDKNADDPAQHEIYLQYRPLMEEEPEWHDGEIREFS